MQMNDGSGRDYSKILSMLNNVVGDTEQEEGAIPSLSPIDLLPVNEMASLGARGLSGLGKAAIESAPKLLGNEVGSVGANIAPHIEKSLADKIKQAAMNSTVKGPEGGLTNSVAEFQQGLKQPEVNFFDKFGPKPVTGPGGEVIDLEKFKQLNGLLGK